MRIVLLLYHMYGFRDRIQSQYKEVEFMAKCEICGKGVQFGKQISHSHRKSNKMWKPNVKLVKVKTDGGTRRMYVCTSCLKSGRVERA